MNQGSVSALFAATADGKHKKKRGATEKMVRPVWG